MAPLCLFYFSHPFGILSPNPPSVTMAPQECIPSWIPSSFTDKSWKQTTFRMDMNLSDTKSEIGNLATEPSKFIPLPMENVIDDNNLKKYEKASDSIEQNKTFSIDTKQHSRTAHDKQRKHKKRERFSCIENERYKSFDKTFLESVNKRSQILREMDDQKYTKAMPWISGSSNIKSGFHRQNHNFSHTLPPLERDLRKIDYTNVIQEWPESNCINKFRRRSLLPPIEMHRSRLNPLKKSSATRSEDIKIVCDEKLEDLSSKDDIEPHVGRVKRKKLKKSARRKIRPIRSSRGVNKGRSITNRSAARKLVTCLLQNATGGHRATTASLPALSEVLRTVRQAWDSPKPLLPDIPIIQDTDRQRVKSKMGIGQPPLPGASPGLLRRRYSLPETVMRKYKLAQQKSESEESEVGSAPSPRIPSPARERGSRGRERGPRSVLLRRLWGRDPPPTLGGSHSELRYWDSRSGSSSPDRACEACKRLSDKNVAASTKAEIHSPPIYKSYATQILMSPKRQKLKCAGSSNQSPERYQTDNSSVRTDVHMRDSRQSISPSTLIATGSSPERLSFKSASVSDTSSKLGLSSLVTSSYPVTETISTSDMTRSSASYSSDEASHAQNNLILIRPKTASDVIKSSPTHKKRRQSVSLYTNSIESPITDSSTALSEQSSSSKESDKNSVVYTTPLTTGDSTDKIMSQKYTSQETLSTSEKTTTTESQTSITTTTTKKDTSSPSDSAMSTHTETDIGGTTEYNDTDTMPPSTAESRSDRPNGKQFNADKGVEFSDTGISETLDYDSSKTVESSHNDEEPNNSKDGSVTYSEDYSVDMVTCIEKSMSDKMSIKPAFFECLEVIVSETLNSSAFEDKCKSIEDSGHESDQLDKTTKDYAMARNLDSIDSEIQSKLMSRIDIDQYVSNILIDSLNTMTDQINEINSNIDDDMKLNILEKEIKVKLQSVSASPINIITNPIITTLITNMPDKELLETTVIEEKMRSLAYTTESKLFPMESKIEIESRHLSNDYENPLEDKIDVDDDPSPLVEESYSENLANETSNSMLTSNSQEMINNNIGFANNNEYQEVSDEVFYIGNSNTDTPLPYDINENEDPSSNHYEDIKTKAVLRQLHKMFENNQRNSFEQMNQSMDTNYNLCVDTQPKAYFCGNVKENASHLEMSTDVDVFVDNSLNKMMNSIDINYNDPDVSKSLEKLSFDEIQNSLNGNTESFEKSEMPHIPPLHISEDSDKEKNNMISNIGTGSLYQKPPQQPLVVPRYSAIPHSESMEVNTSTDEDDDLSCQSDCMSLVDSLDDPNSPRPLTSEKRSGKKVSNYDTKLVRGDIISLLPENSTNLSEVKSPKEKSEKFFIPIREDTVESIKENIVVAEHMPEKLKEKLLQRQQKRELRKEHYRRKRMKQLKKELERQKKTDTEKVSEERDKECLDLISSLVDQVVETNKTEEKKKEGRETNIQASSNAEKKEKKPSIGKRVLKRSEKVKSDDVLKNVESFVIDKKGNFQTKSVRKPVEKREILSKSQCVNADRIETLNLDDSYLYVKNDESDVIVPVESLNVIKTKVEREKSQSTGNRLSGPRRLYQKTEFKEGNKHVEILEIVECLDSSPEPPSDDSQGSPHNPRRSNSKIPVLQKVSKNKNLPKSGKSSRSPINKNVPMNISLAKNERDHFKAPNSKTDQLIANILIDAFNQDNPEKRDVNLVLSPRDRKPVVSNNKKNPTQPVPSRRASIPQQKSNNLTNSTKYTRKFEVIPEERSSMSVESSNEDVNGANINRRSSLPSDLKENAKKTSELLSTKKNDNNVTKETASRKEKGIIKERLNTINEDTTNLIKSECKNTAENTSITIKKKSESHDMSTSPIPQYISTATSPIPPSTLDENRRSKRHDQDAAHIKGKKALGTREGWVGFCRPQTRYSPDNEGSHPSSNNPSDREAIGKIKSKQSNDNVGSESDAIAPPSQRILRTMDSRENIKQISINHDVTKHTEKKSNEEYLKTPIVKDKEGKESKYSVPEKLELKNKRGSPSSKKHKHDKTNINNSENLHSDTPLLSKDKNKKLQLQKSESHESLQEKVLRLPSPFRNQSFTQSSDMSTSSGSDSEAGNACPVLVPRWPPITGPRHRRSTYNRRPQRQDDSFKMPFQNMSGGWSVTLAGSCYTALPSDVEMKVCFPKTAQQQANSQSDSGLGEDYRKHSASGQTLCKKCGNSENVCQNCKTVQGCKCNAIVKNRQDPNDDSENQTFLPPTQQTRKSSHNSKAESSVSINQVDLSKKYYNYLPDLNSVHGLRNKKKASIKMARRFSLHCWLPEDRTPERPKVAKIEMTESIAPVNEDGLSVFGSAIMPELKPRVPTMSERDLTRVHTAQFYSRHRQI